jgi:hypothetical protein
MNTSDSEIISPSQVQLTLSDGASHMKFEFRLKNRKRHTFTLPDDAEVHRAIIWVSKKDKNKEMTRVIVIPDDVEKVYVLD